MSNFRLTKKIFATLAGTTVLASQAFGASFSIKEQNTSYLGTAYSGTAALASDASTGFYNPAGLAYIGNHQLVSSLVGIYGDFEVQSTAAGATFSPLPGQAVTPGTSSAKGWNAVPAFYFNYHWNDKISTSLNMFTPFGLKTDYCLPHPGQYLATRSELRTVAIGPAMSYRINDQWAVGVGVDMLYAKAWLFNDVRVPIMGGIETTAHARADDYTWGFRVGVIHQLSDDTRMGLNYRHKYSVRANGDIFDGATGVLRKRELTASLNLPELVTYSVVHQYDENWAVMADVEWTHWSRLKTLALNFSDGQSQTLQLFYKNVWRIALGTHYRYNEQWKFKAGMAFDDAPTRDEHRSLRIPDSRRIWVGTGAQYRLNRCMAFEVAYAHLFFKNAPLNDEAPIASGPGAIQGGQFLNGSMKASANLVGVQLTWDIV